MEKTRRRGFKFLQEVIAIVDLKSDQLTTKNNPFCSMPLAGIEIRLEAKFSNN